MQGWITKVNWTLFLWLVLVNSFFSKCVHIFSELRTLILTTQSWIHFIYQISLWFSLCCYSTRTIWKFAQCCRKTEGCLRSSHPVKQPPRTPLLISRAAKRFDMKTIKCNDIDNRKMREWVVQKVLLKMHKKRINWCLFNCRKKAMSKL